MTAVGPKRSLSPEPMIGCTQAKYVREHSYLVHCRLSACVAGIAEEYHLTRAAKLKICAADWEALACNRK